MSAELKCPRCNNKVESSGDISGDTMHCQTCGATVMLARTLDYQPEQQTQSHPQSTVEIGSQLKTLGRFRIDEELGAGAFGTVYRGFDPQLKRDVALKTPRSDRSPTPQDEKLFFNEAQAAARLRHPNIVPVYEAGADQGRLFLASAYIEGRTLQRECKLEWPDRRRSVGIVKKLAEALHYAHRQDVVHRDVKPGNIILDRNGEPQLTDFGLAHIQTLQDHQAREGNVFGTMAYMSPEQALARHKEIGPASDQYSLGVVLFELLSRRLPFTTRQEIFAPIEQRQPPRPSEIDSEIDKDLDAICRRALAPYPRDRYASCQQLADDLRRWLDDEPIRARKLGPLERLARWRRRNPAAALWSGAFVLVLLTGIAATSMFAGKASRKAKEAARALVRVEQEQQETRRQRDLAEENLRDVRKVLKFVSEVSINKLKGNRLAEQVRKDILETVLQHYSRYAKKYSEDAALQSELANAHFQIGALLTTLRRMPEAAEAYEKAIDVYSRVIEKSPQDYESRHQLAMACVNLANVYHAQFQVDKARPLFEKARRQWQTIAEGKPNELRYQSNAAMTHMYVGLLENEPAKRLEFYSKSEEELRRILKKHPQHSLTQQNLALLLLNTANVLDTLGAFDDAVRCGQESARYAQQRLDVKADDHNAAAGLVSAYHILALAEKHRGNNDASLRYSTQAIAIQRQLLKNEPPDSELRDSLAMSLNNRGLHYAIRLGEFEKARKDFLEGIAIREKILQTYGHNLTISSNLGNTYANYAELEFVAGNLDKAEQICRQALELHQQVVKAAPDHPPFRQRLQEAEEVLRRILAKKTPVG